jgi:tellurite resistance protein TehA-like permease
MFHQVAREFSISRWTVQLLAVYCIPTLLAGLLENSLRNPYSPAWQASIFPVVALIGGVAGVGVYRMASDLAQEGVWVWLLPTCVLAAFILCDRFSTVSDFKGFFYAPAGDPDPVPAILTLPTWGCCWYSAGMYWRSRSSRQHRYGASVR